MTTPILVVDDDPTYFELLEVAAQRVIGDRFEWSHLEDGQDVLPFLERADAGEAPWPHIVLLDLRMPRMGGLEVLQKLEADPRFRRIPIGLMSSSDIPGEIRRAYEAGANFYVTKPMAFRDLEALVSRLAAFWLDTARVPDHSATLDDDLLQ
ncbi:MAG: response regulator [Alphaproteobacteria bacterium]|nr:response regulator [Alphaproteobacteria bacterium]